MFFLFSFFIEEACFYSTDQLAPYYYFYLKARNIVLSAFIMRFILYLFLVLLITIFEISFFFFFGGGDPITLLSVKFSMHAEL